jgi:predicted alpha/beta superfamily hydrolase
MQLMRKIYLLFIISASLFSCSHEKKEAGIGEVKQEFTIYSATIRDSFVITVQVPEAYFTDSTTHFPSVYMVDANFHFPMLASVVAQYEKGGLLPPLILVGIGYKSFQLMDSLRVRDYLYPAALPSDEINAIGGGMKFDEFITQQLIAYIDSNFRTDSTNRSLLGHSFGGYFSLYALLHQLETNRNEFKNFVAASPSLWYNKFYLNQITDKLKTRASKDSLDIFLSVGGLEDSTWDIGPGKKLFRQLKDSTIKNIKVQYKIYNDLGHMDVPLLTFTKGLQAFYNKKENQ